MLKKNKESLFLAQIKACYKQGKYISFSKQNVTVELYTTGRIRQPNNRGCNQFTPELHIYDHVCLFRYAQRNVL